MRGDMLTTSSCTYSTTLHDEIYAASMTKQLCAADYNLSEVLDEGLVRFMTHAAHTHGQHALPAKSGE